MCDKPITGTMQQNEGWDHIDPEPPKPPEQLLKEAQAKRKKSKKEIDFLKENVNSHIVAPDQEHLLGVS